MDERFEETVTLIRENSALLHSSMDSVTRQKFIGEDEVYIPYEKSSEMKDTAIVLSRVNTVMTASVYKEWKCAVVNLSAPASADGKIPSGKFILDESLGFSTTLWPSIMTPCIREGYSRGERRNTHTRRMGDIIYFPDIRVFRLDGKNLLSEEDFFSINVVTSVIPEKDEFLCLSEEKKAKLVEKTAHRILTVASGEGNEAVVIPVSGYDLTLEGKSWKELLTGKFHNVFSCVSFVLDESQYSEFSSALDGINTIDLIP